MSKLLRAGYLGATLLSAAFVLAMGTVDCAAQSCGNGPPCGGARRGGAACGSDCLMHFGPRRCGECLRQAGQHGGAMPMVLGGAPERFGPTTGYVAPADYGYWAEYGYLGPHYGAWYGPGGYHYYSHTGDYPTPFLPPPSMRIPPP